MLIGLAAGSIAAIVVALVSLPLNSPVDNVFNSATAGLASLIVGIVAGWLWVRLAANPRRVVYYVAVLVAGLVAAVVLAVVGNIWLERLVSFAVPLAAIAFVLSGALVPLLERTPPMAMRWAAPVFLIAAVALGGGLVGQGDAESGELSLPERVEAPAAPPAAPVRPSQRAWLNPLQSPQDRRIRWRQPQQSRHRPGASRRNHRPGRRPGRRNRRPGNVRVIIRGRGWLGNYLHRG